MAEIMPWIQFGLSLTLNVLTVWYLLPRYRTDLIEMQERHLNQIGDLHKFYRKIMDERHAEYIAIHAEHKSELTALVEQNRKVVDENTRAISSFDGRLMRVESKVGGPA